MLPDSLIEVDADKNEDVFLALKAEALVEKLAYKIPEAKAESLGRTLSYAERQTTNADAG